MCIIGRRWRKRLRDCSLTSWIELAGNLAPMESGGLQMGGTVYEPLAGVKVLSFEIAFALPAGTRTLAELGAEVVRVPPPARDVGNYIGVVDGAGLLRKCRSRRRGSEGPGTTFQLVRTPEGARSPPTTFTHQRCPSERRKLVSVAGASPSGESCWARWCLARFPNSRIYSAKNALVTFTNSSS